MKMIISMGEVILASERTRLGGHLEKLSLRMTSHMDDFTWHRPLVVNDEDWDCLLGQLHFEDI